MHWQLLAAKGLMHFQAWSRLNEHDPQYIFVAERAVDFVLYRFYKLTFFLGHPYHELIIAMCTLFLHLILTSSDRRLCQNVRSSQFCVQVTEEMSLTGFIFVGQTFDAVLQHFRENTHTYTHTH